MEMMINSDWLQSMANSNYDFLSQLIKELDIDPTLLNINRFFSNSGRMDDYYSKIDTSLEQIANMTTDELEKYINDTTEITELEKIQNLLSFTKDWLEGKNSWFNLANIALGMYIASGTVDLFKNLTNFIGGWKNGGGLAGGLAKLLGGKVGSSGLLAASGTLATGLTYASAVAAPIAITAGIGKLSEYFDKKKSSAEADKYALQHPEDKLAQTNKLYKDLKGQSGVNQGYADSTNFWPVWGNSMAHIWNNTFGRIGGAEHDNRNYLNILRNSERMNAYWQGNQGQDILELLYYVLVDYAGSLGQFGYTTDELKEVLKDRGYTPDTIYEALNSGYPILWDNPPKTPGGYQITKEEVMNNRTWFNRYLKNGLNWVPRDGFRAMLHKGEMVLNADEANRYRALEKNIGGDSVGLYNNQQKIILGKIVPSGTDVGYAGSIMGLPSGWYLTSAYGTYTNIRDNSGKIKQHKGLDFGAATGTPIRANSSGKIMIAKNAGDGFGNSIKILTDSGLYNRYGHMSTFAPGIAAGKTVRAGQLIGFVGSTGNSTGPHLHFQVDKSMGYNDDINPWPYVNLAMFGGSGKLDVGNATTAISSSASSSGIKVAPSRQFVPIAFQHGGEGGDNSTDRIVGSVSSGIDKIIMYLDNVKAEQAAQRELINAFSQARASESNF